MKGILIPVAAISLISCWSRAVTFKGDGQGDDGNDSGIEITEEPEGEEDIVNDEVFGDTGEVVGDPESDEVHDIDSFDAHEEPLSIAN